MLLSQYQFLSYTGLIHTFHTVQGANQTFSTYQCLFLSTNSHVDTTVVKLAGRYRAYSRSNRPQCRLYATRFVTLYRSSYIDKHSSKNSYRYTIRLCRVAGVSSRPIGRVCAQAGVCQ